MANDKWKLEKLLDMHIEAVPFRVPFLNLTFYFYLYLKAEVTAKTIIRNNLSSCIYISPSKVIGAQEAMFDQILLKIIVPALQQYQYS